MGARGHRLDAVIAGDVLEHQALHLAQRLAVGLLRGERGAELRLVSRSAQEQHELAGDREGDVAVEVLLDEREREVHAGGDARRGPHATVADEDRLGIHEHVAGDRAAAARPTPSAWWRACPRAARHARAGTRRCTPMRCAAPCRRDAAIQSHQRPDPRLRAAGPMPPATISVCSGAGTSANAACGDELRPLVLLSGLAVAAHNQHLVAGIASCRRRAAGAWRTSNTSSGPTTSRLWTSAKARIATRRGRRGTRLCSLLDMAAIILDPGAVCKDMISHFSCHQPTAGATPATAAAEPRAGRGAVGARAGSRMRSWRRTNTQSSTSSRATPTRCRRPPSRVASIVGAAERAAAELREQAETRARERIAEADRAADNRAAGRRGGGRGDARRGPRAGRDRTQRCALGGHQAPQRRRARARGGRRSARAGALGVPPTPHRGARRIRADPRRGEGRLGATARGRDERRGPGARAGRRADDAAAGRDHARVGGGARERREAGGARPRARSLGG